MPNHDRMTKRQQVLADFGEFTLSSEDLDAVLTEACRLVGEALGTGRAKVLEIQDGGRSLFVRAGVGWDPEVVGHVRMPMSEHSSETFAIREGKPVISQDINKEERFVFPEFMKKAGVIALVNVPIRVPGGKAYGLLQVDATEPRDFGNEDTEFLRTYATILGPVIDRLRKLNALRVTEERFRLVVENARDYAIFTSDPEDRITDWYSGAEAVYGWTAEEAIGQPATIIFTPEDREAGQDARETGIAAREGSAPNVRWHVRKDGSRVFIEGMTTSLRAADGSLQGFLKIGQDVTERRVAEERLRNALAIKTVGVIFWGADFRLVEVNDAFLMMSGFSREEAIGKSWQELTPKEFYPASRNAVEQLLTVGEAVPYEKQYFRKDGSRWWGLFAPRKIGEETVEFVLDISSRKQAEAALRDSEERQRALIEGVPQLVWRAVNGGDWTWASPQWSAYTGQPEEQSHGLGWLAPIHPDDRAGVMAAWDAAERNGALMIEHRIRNVAEDRYRWFATRATPVRNGNGEIDEWLGTSTDIDAMRKLQARLEVLVNELQHRSRNLLGVVTAVADRTVNQGGSVEAFKERMQALGRAQGLLSQGGNDAVEVSALVWADLAVHADRTGDRVAVSGPKVLLTARQVQNFALAVHELATNAMKHGALKAEAGRLDVTWDVVLDRRGRRRLALNWIESGVAIEPDKVTRRGYGTELIQEALAYALEAEVDYVLGGDGVRCRIEMPITQRE